MEDCLPRDRRLRRRPRRLVAADLPAVPNPLGSPATPRHSTRDAVCRAFTDGLLSALPHMKEFRDTVFSAPRLTTRFNRSKRRAVSALDALLSAFAQGEVSCARAERSILELLEPEH